MASTELVAESIQKLFNDPTYSDLVVRCGNREWWAHKAIVCTRCHWFEKACRVPMKEAQDGVIEIREVEGDVVDAMLYYLYAGDYHYSEEDRAIPKVIFHVHMHIAADQFDLPKLSELAAMKFRSSTGSPGDLLPDAFARVVELAYNSDPDRGREIRDHIIKVACEMHEDLYTGEDCAAFREITSEISAFNAELLVAVAKKEPPVCCEDIFCYRCCHDFGVPSPQPGQAYYCVYCGTEAFYGGIMSADSP